jgi:hypothetical protein
MVLGQLGPGIFYLGTLAVVLGVSGVIASRKTGSRGLVLAISGILLGALQMVFGSFFLQVGG